MNTDAPDADTNLKNWFYPSPKKFLVQNAAVKKQRNYFLLSLPGLPTTLRTLKVAIHVLREIARPTIN
jgi:hypothetical protein